MLNNLQNLHTHTKICDGKDTPEEIVLTAIEKGFSSLGFSGHSYMSFAPDHSMSLEGTKEYKKEVACLKEKYKDKIDIFLGLEVEKHSEVDMSDYEYLIGSAHYFYINGEHIGFDRDLKTVQNVVNSHFGGDGMKYAKAYYNELATLPEHGSFDIIGHFDLITKHAENCDLFDIGSKEYLNYALEAMDALKGKIPFFEINTGAVSRGYRTTPYPDIRLTEALLKNGFLPLLSSDCHDRSYLDCAFEESVQLLEQCGAKERYILTENGFKAVGLR